jgi:4-hydroxy-tetrahydrodipicolinate synthase
MVGTSGAATGATITEVEAIDDIGADSILVMAPSGWALSEAEIRRHFTAVRESTTTPLVAYEAPDRVGLSLSIDLLHDLGADGVIAGVKDSSGDLQYGRLLRRRTRDLESFLCYTGTEECIDMALLAGFDGAIPGLANIFPDFHIELVRRAASGDFRGAADIQECIISLLAIYNWPIPGASPLAQFFASVKAILVQRGTITSATTSLPLTEPPVNSQSHIQDIARLSISLAASVELRSAVCEAG